MSVEPTNIRVRVGVDIADHHGHLVRSVVIDKTSAIKGIYCTNDRQIVEYLFRRARGWDEDSAAKWASEHAKSFTSFQHVSVDQASEFLKVIGTTVQGASVIFLPNSPSYKLDTLNKLGRRWEVLPAGDPPHEHNPVELDENGNGDVLAGGTDAHTHKVVDFQVQPGPNGHTHELGQEVPGDTAFPAVTGTEVKGQAKPVSADMGTGLEIIKLDEERHLVYGVFLWPERPDHDGDVISAQDIEKVAHGFMADYRTIDEMHKQVIEADIVESAIAWEDGLNFHGKPLSKGAWFGAVKVHDEQVWEKIKQGDYKGFSVRISGVREPIGQEA